MHFKNETEFNAAVRGVFRTWEWGCVHVREADTPGVLDLVAWKPNRVWWIELKVDDEEIRSSQLEFIRDHPRVSSVFRWRSTTEILEITQQGRLKMVTWPAFSSWVSTI